MSPSIEVLVTPNCPYAARAERLVREVAGSMVPGAEITWILVRDPAEAERLGFPGSPTVRIDGEDLERPEPGRASFGCRLYEGAAGAPPAWLVEAAILRALRPRHLLFLCVANSARSQMAEGIARSLAPAGTRISSAGSTPTRINPYALQALAEIGIDAASQRSKGVEEVVGGNAYNVDAVITLCADEVCPVWLADTRQLHWPLPDPAAAPGSDEEILGSFRRVRDELRTRLGHLFGREGPADA